MFGCPQGSLSAVNVLPSWAELEALSFTITADSVYRSRSTYRKNLRGFEVFCALYDIPFPPLGQAGVSAVICYYSYLIFRGLKFASLSNARSAISEHYHLHGVPSPCDDWFAVARFRKHHKWCDIMRPVLRSRCVPDPVILSVAHASLCPSPALLLWYFAFSLLAVCAVRSGSLLALSLSDFLFEDTRVRIRWRVVKARVKPVFRWYVLQQPLWPGWRSLLLSVLSGCRSRARIFEGLDAKDLGNAVRELCLRAGMDTSACEGLGRVTPRSLRRAAAQRALAFGKSDVDIAFLLMHRSTAAQEPYLRDGPGKTMALG